MVRKSRNYWTLERIAEAAKPFPNRRKFKLGASAAYQAAIKRGVLDIVCAHMQNPQHEKNYWTFERITQKALQYPTRGEFRDGSPLAYSAARRSGVLSQVCQHMTRKGNRFARYVYEIVDHERRVAYVGLSRDPQRRLEQHVRQSKHITDVFGFAPPMVVVTDLIEAEQAATQEAIRVSHYRDFLGYQVLNIAKAGSLGGGYVKYTDEEIASEAAKYVTRKAFMNGSREHYKAACHRDLLDNVCGHMMRLRQPDGYWTFERIADVAKQYRTRTEFATKNKRVYFQACKFGVLDTVCAHMPKRAPKSR